MKFKKRTIDALADMICGNTEAGKEKIFPYRSSSVITRFFRDCDTDYCHDGSTRNWWVGERLREILLEPQPDANTPPDTFARVIRTLMDVGEATDEDPGREKALAALNGALAREGFEAFYAADKQCYPQFFSRIGFVHEFRPLSDADLQVLLEQLWAPLGIHLPAPSPAPEGHRRRDSTDPRQLPLARSLADSNGTRTSDQRS